MQRHRTATATIVIVLGLIAAIVAFGPAVEVRDALPIPVDDAILAASGQTSAIVHVAPDADLDAVHQRATAAGLLARTRWPRIDAFVADGPAELFARFASDPDVVRLEHNAELRVFTETSHQATHSQDLLDGAVTLPGGEIIDGTGVGVAIVDTGVDGTHPDLTNRMGGNVRFVSFTGQAVPVADSDTTGAGGHGTHVAGIVAGDGTASDGRFHGAAPDATLYGVGSGTVVLVESAIDGLNWVLENHDQVDPPIRVVNNSWGGDPGEYDSSAAVHQMSEALVAEGVVVVFAAGNDGGDGSTQTTSYQCVNPTPGIICVGSYYDQDRGTDSKGVVSSYSSRGQAGHPESYPDVIAPGQAIVSTCRLTLPVCSAEAGPETDPPNAYASLSGTSMAAPHVAGIVAQILEVDPTLTPAEVELLLENTATPISRAFGELEPDPFNPTTPTSYDQGHGLVNVLAAVEQLLAR